MVKTNVNKICTKVDFFSLKNLSELGSKAGKTVHYSINYEYYQCQIHALCNKQKL